ncbi:MAG: inorganic phosphate transporter [Prevotellaceae bacterium]|nr:inorganic phosphate transporter [Prevotellaceae bacterium]
MNILFLGIVVFLILLAIFDLVVGVSNDAVNFLNSAIGAKVAKFRTIAIIAAIGVFLGAAMSNGMMDVARHGIMTPAFFSFYDVICIFLAVMITDVILLDVFNTLGMPTSTTVSMVFELLGGSFAIALLKIIRGAAAPDGTLLTLGDLLNTEKAMSVILGIFLSVAIAFVLGAVVQWIARLVFSFTYRVNGTTTDLSGKMGNLFGSSLKSGILSGISVTVIIWFLLINGLKGSTFMTDDVRAFISQNTWYVIGGGVVVFSVIMSFLSALKVPVLKFVVLLGTMALAMAFASNDLVNFVGVPLTGLESYQDFMANGDADASSFMMSSLMENAHTPVVFLVCAGIIMVLSLAFSKKARNVVKTSVDLSRQDEGDEMFGSSNVARVVVRSCTGAASFIAKSVPRPVAKWIDSRFNVDDSVMPEGAAFDQIRAIVNLVLASLLVALGTSLKLPLSTTYVTFMVAMGSSLADRAWGRESAVFRITGVLSVIGGWFITAGVAFIISYLLANVLFFGNFPVMILAVILAIFILLRNNLHYKDKQGQSEGDVIFSKLIHSRNEAESWSLLTEHVRLTGSAQLAFIAESYHEVTEAFFHEEYRRLKRATGDLEEERKDFKRQRRREILGLRRVNPILAVERNTWYFLTINAVSQMLYSLKRILDLCREHVGNNFSPVPPEYVNQFQAYSEEIDRLLQRGRIMIGSGDLTGSHDLRADASKVQQSLALYRKTIIDEMQQRDAGIESMSILLNLVQESQELLSGLRHMVRAARRFLEKADERQTPFTPKEREGAA